MRGFYFIFAILLIANGLSHSEEGEDVHFYCRVCGAHITNATNIINKEAKDIYFNSYLENQASGVKIPYDSFIAPSLWKGKKLTYFNDVSAYTTMGTERLTCPHFEGFKSSSLTCDKCKTSLGYYLYKETEEEFGEDLGPERDVDYDEDEIAEMFPFSQEDLDIHISKTFESIPSPSRTQGYWSYRYNHKQGVDQYHAKSPSVPNDLDLKWSLGKYDEERSGFYGIDKKVDPPKPYYYYTYTGGQNCDEIKAPRETEVRFQGCDQRASVVFQSVEEVSICKYVINICLPSLEMPKKREMRKDGFYALDMDSVIPDSDNGLQELMKRDYFHNSVEL